MRIARHIKLAIMAAIALYGVSGCGSVAKSTHGAQNAKQALQTARREPSPICATTVLDTLSHVAMHVYHEGISSNRTQTALHFITQSSALQNAVARDDPQATRIAIKALIGTGHVSRLQVTRGSKVLADIGSPLALTPVHGTLRDGQGKVIASFLASVQEDLGYIGASGGLTDAQVTIRRANKRIAGARELPDGALPAKGKLTSHAVTYQYVSFAAREFPSGGLRIYVARPLARIAALCGRTSQATVVNTLSQIAYRIYHGELSGPSVFTQVRRVQHNQALLRAVSQRDPLATRQAVIGLLNQHIVRLRVSSDKRLLSDVGGPYVLAPVSAPLSLGGRTIGSFVLSIQDDEGYKRLAQRLAGLGAVMYMGARLVKSTLGSAPGPIPTSGSLLVSGRSYRLYTFNGEAFPSGPLRITVLIPIPYS